METKSHVCVYYGEQLASYGFGQGHPFSTRRLDAYWQEMLRQGVDKKIDTLAPNLASRKEIEQFHTNEYVERVRAQSQSGEGFLDAGDTPAFKGVFEAASYVVGSGIDAVERIMKGEYRRAFVPIGGLHHAARNSAAGFCVFNDCGVVIETLRNEFNIRRIVYVDIDAHHGDGVFYAFEEDPEVIIADIHEDGRFLYPGTGNTNEVGKGKATGSKVNFCLQPGAGDDAFAEVWKTAEDFVRQAEPDFILLQCGADSLGGDPITHLRLTENSHALVAESLCRIAEIYCQGRIIGFGGGGYNEANIGKAWTAVVNALVSAPYRKS